MKTLSIINLKGGVGKTTIAVNLAYALAESWGAKVLFIDNDKQGNSSDWLGVDPTKPTLSNLYLDDCAAADVIQHSEPMNFDFIASDMGLIEAHNDVIKASNGMQIDILKKKLAPIAKNYQLCIIDNPPDINIPVTNALVMSDDVILVTTPEFDSLTGIYNMMPHIQDARRFNPKLNLAGVLINQFLSSSDVYGYMTELESKGFKLFASHVLYASRGAKKNLVQARKKHMSIFQQNSRCRISRDIMAFAEELMGG